LSNLVYESDLVVKLVEEVQTVIDFEKIPIIQMFMDKARTEAQAEAAQVQAEAEARAAQAQAEAEARAAQAEVQIVQERRNAYADALMKILQRQYGRHASEELQTYIFSIEDDGKLATLIESALDLTTVEQFREVLDAS
jgi:regulator of protease activity HflC (stomatin/prohibitin superfamily)